MWKKRAYFSVAGPTILVSGILLGAPPPPSPAISGTVRALEDAGKIAVALRRFNTEEIERSRALLRKNIKGLAWGLLAFGVIASLGGIFLGYVVARALRKSIHQL